MSGYKDLKVWQESVELVLMIYQITEKFPDSEKFGLTNQMRRASVSIPSNIAEGYGRTTGRDIRKFIGNARGSCYELDTQSLLAYKLGLLGEEEFGSLNKKVELIAKMINGLYRHLSKQLKD